MAIAFSSESVSIKGRCARKDPDLRLRPPAPLESFTEPRTFPSVCWAKIGDTITRIRAKLIMMLLTLFKLPFIDLFVLNCSEPFVIFRKEPLVTTKKRRMSHSRNCHFCYKAALDLRIKTSAQQPCASSSNLRSKERAILCVRCFIVCNLDAPSPEFGRRES